MVNNSTGKFLSWAFPGDDKTADKQYVGIGQFKTFVEISSNITCTATAPRFVTEDLKTAQDSIINEPKSITITGEVADLFIENDIDDGAGSTFQTILNNATPYLPDRTLSQIQKVENFANDIENTIDRVNNFTKGVDEIAEAIGILPGAIDSKSNKELFFDKMQQYYDTKTPITFETLYREYKNWAMTSFSYEEDNEIDNGTFSITLEELRIIDLDLFRNDQLLTPAEEAKKDVNSTLNGQTDSVTNKGITDGLPVSSQLADFLLEDF